MTKLLSEASPAINQGYEIMSHDPNKEMKKPENSSNHHSDSEQETWFEGVNKALPEVNINIFKEAIEISEKVYKNIKKNYGS